MQGCTKFEGCVHIVVQQGMVSCVDQWLVQLRSTCPLECSLLPLLQGGTAKWKKGSKVLVPHTDQYYVRGTVEQFGGLQAACGRISELCLPCPAHVTNCRSSPACGALQAAVVLQGQKRADGQWYLLHYDGAPEGHCRAVSLLEACSRPPRFCWPLLCNHRASLLPSLCPGWSNKYNEWVEESGLVRWDKTLLEQSAAAAGNPPGDLAGRKVGLGGSWGGCGVLTAWLMVMVLGKTSISDRACCLFAAPCCLQRKADIAPAEPSLAVEIPQQLRLHIPPLLKKVVLDDSTQVGETVGGGQWAVGQSRGMAAGWVHAYF